MSKLSEAIGIILMVFLVGCAPGFDAGNGYRINGIKFRPSCDVKVQKECVKQWM